MVQLQHGMEAHERAIYKKRVSKNISAALTTQSLANQIAPW